MRKAGDDGAAGIRCAIYTRKSTEEGLDRDFNTLDAQREAGEAYVASQRSSGWVCLDGRYDDGGYTGGNTQRPALQRLLADIEAGDVDCVVVYKVDRLSRSLADFAKMMEVFEAHGVSFVSVTQQINTSTSAGRLMLNILFSFAEYERELISERTRDKIAAARRRGKWAGGRPVLGYDLVRGPGGSRLEVNEAEAALVRRIFALYLEGGTLLSIVAEARRHGWTTKRWTTKSGRAMGGRAMDKGVVHALLTNPVYTGKVKHRDELFEGEHEAIVDADDFTAVQGRLRLNGATGGSMIRNKHHARLKGLVHCAACGRVMGHHFASSADGSTAKRYRYYVCQRAQQEGWTACPGPSLPAGDLEAFVVDRIREAVTGDGVIDAVVARAMRMVHEQRPDLAVDPDEAVGAMEGFDGVWEALTPKERVDLVHALVARVEWDAEAEEVRVTFTEQGTALCGGDGIEEAA